METLATWPSGWSIVGDDTNLALAFGEDQDNAENATWDLAVYEDDTERAVEYADLLSKLLDAKIIDTDTLSGIVVNVGQEFDFYDEGTARGLYRLKSGNTDTVYAAESDDYDRLVSLMQEYTDNDTATA